MKTFMCPARYLPVVQAAISIAIADVGRDVKRRDRGEDGSTFRNLLDETLAGDCVVMIGIADPDAQAADLDWPAEHIA